MVKQYLSVSHESKHGETKTGHIQKENPHKHISGQE